jgi:superfamily II DNA or RNA helicase
MRSRTILAGLRHEVEKYCRAVGYEIKYLSDFSEHEFSIKEGIDFIRSLNLPADRVPHDYQVAAVVKSIRQKRRLTLLPTASGKSLVIYMLSRFYKGRKLIITPGLTLIHQMADDFVSYGADPNSIHKIYEGQTKNPIRIKLFLEDGSHLVLDGNEMVKLLNNSIKKVIEVTSSDEIDDRWLQEYRKKQVV